MTLKISGYTFFSSFGRPTKDLAKRSQGTGIVGINVVLNLLIKVTMMLKPLITNMLFIKYTVTVLVEFLSEHVMSGLRSKFIIYKWILLMYVLRAHINFHFWKKIYWKLFQFPIKYFQK